MLFYHDHFKFLQSAINTTKCPNQTSIVLSLQGAQLAFVFGAAAGGPSNHSPRAHIPADHTSNSELMQKKLIV